MRQLLRYGVKSREEIIKKMASEDIYPDFDNGSNDNGYNDKPEDRQPEMGDSHYDNYRGRMSDFDGNMEEGWGDDNLVAKLSRKIKELEEKLNNCNGDM